MTPHGMKFWFLRDFLTGVYVCVDVFFQQPCMVSWRSDGDYTSDVDDDDDDANSVSEQEPVSVSCVPFAFVRRRAREKKGYQENEPEPDKTRGFFFASHRTGSN